MAEKDDEERWEWMLLPVLSAECSPILHLQVPLLPGTVFSYLKQTRLRENVLVLENATTATFLPLFLTYFCVQECSGAKLFSHFMRKSVKKLALVIPPSVVDFVSL